MLGRGHGERQMRLVHWRKSELSNVRCSRRAIQGLRMLRMRFDLTRPQLSLSVR